MPRKAREIFKSQGFTDAEIDANPLFNDARWTAAIEAEDADRETFQNQATNLQRDLDATTEWYQTKAVPALDKALKDSVTARGRVAQLEAELRTEQEYGMRRQADQDPNRQTQTNRQDTTQTQTQHQDPNRQDLSDLDSRYVNAQTFQAATREFGDFAAEAADMVEDYRELFGTRLPGGVSQLRKDYQDAVTSRRIDPRQVGMRAFFEQKYAIPTKRQEIAAANVEKTVNDRVQARVTEELAKQFNPNTRSFVSSRSPFTRQPVANGTVDGAQPWEKGNDLQRRQNRVVKFVQQGVKVGT